MILGVLLLFLGWQMKKRIELKHYRWFILLTLISIYVIISL